MAIRITCPDCETAMRVPDDLRGKRVRCKKCKTAIRIPAGDDDDDEEQQEAPPSPRPRKTMLATSIKADAKPTGNAKAKPTGNAKAKVPAVGKSESKAKPAASSTKKEKSAFPLVGVLVGVAGLMLVLCLAGGGVGGYFLFLRSPKTPDQAKLDDKAKDEKPKQEEKSEPVTIKLKKRGDGETAFIAQTVTRTLKLKQTDEKGKVLFDLDSKDVDVSEYKETILKREKDKFPAKLEREYTNAQSTRDGKTTDIPVAGKSVIIEKQPAGNPSKFSFVFKGGGKLSIDITKILADEFADRKDGPLDDPEYLILPKSAVKPGDSWKPDTEALIKDFAKEDKRKTELGSVTANARLVKTYQKDNRLYGVLEGTIEISVKGAMKGTKDEVRYRDGSKIAFEINLDVCIDGSAELGTTRIRMTFVQDGEMVKRPGATESANVVQEVTRIASADATGKKTSPEKPKPQPKDDLVTIKLKKRDEGEAGFFAITKTTTLNMKITDQMGKVLADNVNKDTNIQQFKETILQRDENNFPAKLERDYIKAQTTKKGKTTDWPVAGRAIVIERQGTKLTFTPKGGANLPTEFVTFLVQGFGKTGDTEGELEYLILPRSAVKPGESWKPDIDPFVREIDPTGDVFSFAGGARGDARLVRTYQKDNRLYGVLAAKFDISLKAMGKGKGEIRFREGGKLSLEVDMDVCIDGSAELGTVRVRIIIAGNGEQASLPGSAVAFNTVDEVTRIASAGPASK